MFKKLRIKFIATIMMLLTSIVILIITSIYIGMKRNGEYMLLSQVGETLNNIRVGPNGDIMGRGRPGDNSIIVVYDIKTARFTYSNAYEPEEEILIILVQEALKSSKDKGFVSKGDYNFAYMYRNTPMGIEIVLKDSSIHKKTMNKLIITSGVIGSISLVFLFLVSTLIANKSIKPVEAAYNSQKRFIADASHELKTPLAVIKTNLDVLNSNEKDTIYNQKKWIDYISFQTDRMSKLVSNLLYLAKADNNEELGVNSSFNISDVIMNQLLTFEAVVYENFLNLNCNIEPNIKFYGDRESIIQLVGILMDNAIKHAYKNTDLNVELRETKQKIIFSVTNKGEVIPKDDIDKIFDRFYRVDKSREREKGGYGLGLSIAKSIVDKYKGNIKVISDKELTKFSVELMIQE